MTFEWDLEKEERNKRKHGIDFSTAATVFSDEGFIERYDEDHSTDEDRYIVIGRIKSTLIIVRVVYTERADAIRIISARIANKKERGEYYDR